MIVSITGSRSLDISFEDISTYLPESTTSIVSGGALGVDSIAAEYAREHGLELVVIRPDYTSVSESRRFAPLLRNTDIVTQSDYCIFFWDGRSRGTSHTITEARRLGRHGVVIIRGSYPAVIRF